MKNLLIFLLLLANHAFGTNWYVYEGGTLGSGTLANPWTYAQYNATGSIAAGDSVSFNRGGTYYGYFSTGVGTAGNLVRHGTYGSGAKPKLTAMIAVTGWTNTSGNIWQATLSMPGVVLRMLTLDGVKQRMGRYPNTGYLTYPSHSQTAQGTAVRSGTTIASVTINNGGTNYPSAPIVTFIGGGGTGAAGTAVLTSGIVTSVTMTNNGTGYTTTPTVTFTANGNSAITGPTVGAIPFNPAGAEVVIRKYRWIIDRHTITSRVINTLNYTASCCPFGNNTAYDPIDNNGYFIQNSLSTLDQDGEWFHNSATNTLYLYSTTNPNSRTVKVSNIETLNYLHSYTTYTNLEFEGSTTAIDCQGGQTTATFYNCDFNFQGGWSVFGQNATNIRMSGCSFSENWNTAFQIVGGASNTLIVGCTFNNIGNVAGMSQSGDGGARAISITGGSDAGTQALYNTITNVGFSAIYFQGSNVLVRGNYINNFCQVQDDGGGVYCYAQNPTDTFSNRIIEYNTILNGGLTSYDGLGAFWYEAYGLGHGVYLDGYSNHVIVRNNTIAYSEAAGIIENGNTDNTITNNLCYANRWGVWLMAYQIGRIRNLVMTGNQFIAKSTQRSLYLRRGENDPVSSFGTINSNYYARPVADDNVMNIDTRFGTQSDVDITLANWKSTYGVDAASLGSAVLTGNDAFIRFDYNITNAPVVVNLGAVYKSIPGTTYNGSITLPAYTGSVLVYYSSLVNNHIAFGTQPTNAVAAASISPAITVQVLDAGNSVVTTDNTTQVTLVISSNPGGGTLSGTVTQTAINGIATFSNLSINKSGTAYTLSASSSPALNSVVSSAFNISAGAASQIGVNTGDNQSATVGTAVGTLPSVIVRDANGNVVSGVSVTFAVISGGGSATGLNATTNSSGIATVGSWTLGAIAGVNTLRATSAGLAGSPFTFTATGTAATRIETINGKPATWNSKILIK